MRTSRTGRLRAAIGSRSSVAIAAVVLIGGLLAPAAWAQQASGIAGQVTDTTGAALPGVTVDAASPALIEGSRTTVTDGEGRYTIIDLRPGAYTVTFTLPGFSTVVRDGIELRAGFTATVPAQLRVGGVEETITVSGAAPVVDVQTVRKQETIAERELQALPTGNLGLQTIAQVIPGFRASSDVGGTKDTWSAQGAYTFYHGKPGTRASFNGFRNQYFVGGATGVGYVTNSDTIAELQLEATGMGAEAGSGSTSLNAIPRDGGNVFSAMLHGKYSNSDMQASNLDDRLRGFGFTTSREAQRVYRMSGTAGGPLARDRLWFFAGVARWGMRVQQPGAYFNKLQGTNFYEADLSRPADDFDWNRSHVLRLTWQAADRHRIGFFGDLQKNCRCTTGFTGANAIEAQAGWDNWPAGVVQTTWTAPMTSRLLLEAGQSWQTYNWVNFAQPGVTRDHRSILETATNFRYQAPSLLRAPKARTGRGGQRFSMSYVTGSHNFKVGVTTEQAFSDNMWTVFGPDGDGTSWRFLRGRPIQIDYLAVPNYQQERAALELGVFAQDAWTLSRVTLNVGVRLDYYNGSYPASSLPAGAFVPARTIEKRSGVPEWTDVNPRVGVVYDLFGNGRTAAKVSLGRFSGLSGSGMTIMSHPFTTSVNQASRAWRDTNENFRPDCDLGNFEANGECGPISDQNFGSFNPRAIQVSDDVLKRNREYTWDFLSEVQHELFRGLSVSVGYNRNWTRNFLVADNLEVGPQDYDPYCVTAPKDPRLPGGGGYQICGLYDIKPEKFGVSRTVVKNDKEFGGISRVWNGFTFSADGRLPKGITVGGGLDVGRQVDDHCITADIPNQPVGGAASSASSLTPFRGGPFCRVVDPWSGQLDVRVRGTVPLPGGVTVSGIYKNLPGVPIDADFVATNADIAPSLGRNLSGGVRAVVVPLYALNSNGYGDRFTQFDLRVTKSIRGLGLGRLDASVDLYNVFNSNSVQSQIDRYGSRWQRPTVYLDGRLLQLTAQLFF